MISRRALICAAAVAPLAGCYSFALTREIMSQSSAVGPVAICNWTIDLNSIGQTMVRVAIGNRTRDRVLQGIKLVLYPHDRFGDPVASVTALRVEATSQDQQIPPMEYRWLGAWTLHGFNGTRAVGIFVRDVLWTTGERWTNPITTPLRHPVWRGGDMSLWQRRQIEQLEPVAPGDKP